MHTIEQMWKHMWKQMQAVREEDGQLRQTNSFGLNFQLLAANKTPAMTLQLKDEGRHHHTF
jgi:hypothetical protein